MTKSKFKFILAALVAVAIAIYIPNVSLAQNGGPAQPAARQAPQPRGGVAIVIGVDQPENCLRIRSGPGSAYEVIGCAIMGEQLHITGVWTSNDWAQTADNGWVYGEQIQTDLRPPAAVYSQAESYPAVEEEYPVYYDMSLDSYLPDYGYETYWYGGIPLYIYNINVWRRFHPWWFRRHWNFNHRVWNRNPAFRRNVTTVRPRNFAINRSNVTRFNANSFRRGTANMLRSGTTFNPNTTFRSFSRPNTIRSGRIFSPNATFRNFSRSNVIRSGRTFTPNTTFRTFSRPNTFRSGSVGIRNFNAGSIRAFSFQGGGANVAGRGRRR
jgi:hypothetical protein